MLIPLLIILPLLSAAFLLLPVQWFDQRRNTWVFALVSSGLTFLLALLMCLRFNWADPTMQLEGVIPWVPSFGLSVSYGIDAIALWLVLLTAFIMPITVLGAFSSVTDRFREFYFWLLILEAAMLGTFLATDVIFFYVCFEFTLIPLFFLIGGFGSANRLHAAKVFFLYTFVGSMLTLAGIVYVAWFQTTVGESQAWTFRIDALYVAAQQMSATQQGLVLGAFLAAFAVKTPLVPFHSWLPLSYTQAPTAGSVLLAAVLAKLGTYGMIRFILPMTPAAVIAYAPAIGVLAVLGILYAGLICWVQKDAKKLVAYSSISHLGFCVLGLFALDPDQLGAVGSVMYMVNHGLTTGALFLCVGMVYERFHTRELASMSGLGQVMPVWAFFTVFFAMASVGLPGLNGFVGEFMTLLGAFTSPASVLGPWFAAFAALGLIIAAMYLLYFVGRVVWGPLEMPEVAAIWALPSQAKGAPHGRAHSHDHASSPAHAHTHARPRDLNLREILTLSPLAVACLGLGLGPFPVLDSLEPSVAQMTQFARAELKKEGKARLPEYTTKPDSVNPSAISRLMFSGDLHRPLTLDGVSQGDVPDPAIDARQSNVVFPRLTGGAEHPWFPPNRAASRRPRKVTFLMPDLHRAPLKIVAQASRLWGFWAPNALFLEVAYSRKRPTPAPDRRVNP